MSAKLRYHFSEILKAAMEKRNLTPRELAAKLHPAISESAIRGWLRGRSEPRYGYLLMLEEVLDLFPKKARARK